MKRLFHIVLLLAAGLVFAACEDTNDRGVIVNKPFDIFGAAATRTPANQPASPANQAPASPTPGLAVDLAS